MRQCGGLAVTQAEEPLLEEAMPQHKKALQRYHRRPKPPTLESVQEQAAGKNMRHPLTILPPR
jgi:hypothetical protein